MFSASYNIEAHGLKFTFEYNKVSLETREGGYILSKSNVKELIQFLQTVEPFVVE
jgi:hypothetical protein